MRGVQSLSGAFTRLAVGENLFEEWYLLAMESVEGEEGERKEWREEERRGEERGELNRRCNEWTVVERQSDSVNENSGH